MTAEVSYVVFKKSSGRKRQSKARAKQQIIQKEECKNPQKKENKTGDKEEKGIQEKKERKKKTIAHNTGMYNSRLWHSKNK